MRLETLKLLLDARAACGAISEFTAGVSFLGYSRNPMMRSAVERQLEIVGEALGRALRTDPELETRLPEIRRIVGLRNRLIHGYDSVDDEIVWDVVQTKVPELANRLAEVTGD